jgi:hypothetical protein
MLLGTCLLNLINLKEITFEYMRSPPTIRDDELPFRILERQMVVTEPYRIPAVKYILQPSLTDGVKRRKSHKRKSHKRKSHKKSNKIKSHKRKSHKRKSHRKT